MKQLLTLTLSLTTLLTQAQVKLDKKDFDHLVALSLLHSKNPNCWGDKFAKSVDSLRTPKLDHIADALIAVGKADKTMMETRFLKRPSDEELQLWYVIREIHYNRSDEKNTPKPDTTVAREVLAKKIDSRWMLDNYYYRLHGGYAKLFNDADLSKYNIEIDSLGFKDETEKAIFYLNTMDALVGGRFKVLSMMKNTKRIMHFCERLPTFNGKAYYYYTSFNYEDFDWIGSDEKAESWNERHIGNLYSILIAHLNAVSEHGKKKDVQELFANSILHEPKYFKYSASKDDLQDLYDKSR